MKRFLKVLFFILLLMPIGIKAYGINNYFIDATIQENGDLIVQEYFSMTGSYNGFERIIKYENSELYEFDPNMTSFGGSLIHNADYLSILEVRAVPINSNFSFDNIEGDIFTWVDSASKGDYGVYEEEYTTDGKSILIYNPSTQNKAFYIKYRLDNLAILHNDVGEIGWNVVGNELSESVSNLKIYLHIPNNTNIKAWAHGPLNGNVNIIDNETVLFTLSGLSSYRAVDIRATFDKEVIKQSKKTTNVDALEKIILYEEDKAEQANYERQNQDKQNIQQAEYYLAQFETYVDRFYYEYALDYINKIADEEKKQQYLTELNEIKILLDQEELQQARNSITRAMYDPTYENYKTAKDDVEVIDNISNKEKLLPELNIVLEKVKVAEKKLEKINWLIGIIITMVISVVGYLIYVFYRKDPPSEFNQEYLRDFPSNYSPEVVSYLFNKKITDNAISAAMMELVRKKIILVEKQEKNNYKLTMNPNYRDELSETEKKLVNLVFHGNSVVYTNKMRKYASDNYSKFISRWNAYQKSAISDGKKENFYEEDLNVQKSKKKNNKFSSILIIALIITAIFPTLLVIEIPILIIYLIYKLVLMIYRKIKNMISGQNSFNHKTTFTIILVILSLISLTRMITILIVQKFYRDSFIVYLLCFIISLILIPLIYNKMKRTVKGAEEYKKWKALKHFLQDFGKFDDKNVQEIALWEKYLVYATLFGCAKKLVKTMKIEMVNDPEAFNDYMDFYTSNRYIIRTINASRGAAISAKSAASSSSGGGGYSSGSGGGGGFSSGGGSFGGGGGGGRF